MLKQSQVYHKQWKNRQNSPFTRRFLWPASKDISKEKMTDDNKKRQRMTKLQNCQPGKRNKEYLEKKSAWKGRSLKQRKLKAQKKTKIFQKMNQLISEEERRNRRVWRGRWIWGRRGSRCGWEKVRKRRERSGCRGARSFREAREKAFIFERLKTKNQRRNRQWKNAISIVPFRLSELARLSPFSRSIFKSLSTQKVIEFSEQSGWPATIVWKKPY